MRSKRLAQKKDKLHNLGSDDRLSRLPDEVLVYVLSSLPLKDAAVTSTLSRRWRYLWCQTDRLVFEDKKSENEQDRCYSDTERDKYISTVNHIIHQHKSSTIGEFKICSLLDENAKGAISKWIEFVISKNVQAIELNFVRSDPTSGNYFFDAPVMEIKFLKSLILKSVDVDDEGLKKILSNCPVLEHLSILHSRKLVKPKIHGKGLALKNLDMKSCYGINSIEICDSNIVSFSSQDFPVTLKFDNLQKLQKICMSKGMNDEFREISSGVPNLQVLELDLYFPQGYIGPHPLPKLQKLEELIIEVRDRDDAALHVLSLLVEACPNLQRLAIKKARYSILGDMNREARQMANKPHQCLEVVEITEYLDEARNLELATYFIQKCVALKKLVIEPYVPRELEKNERKKQKIRNHVRGLLEPRTPVGVELVIL